MQSIISRLSAIAKDFIKIVEDQLGITAGIDCLTKGEIGACVETAANILMSAVGGIIGKILAKYGAPWKWAKAVRLGKTLWGLVHKGIDLIKDFFKIEKGVKEATKAAEEAKNVEKAVGSCSTTGLCPQKLHWANEPGCFCTGGRSVSVPALSSGELAPPPYTIAGTTNPNYRPFAIGLRAAHAWTESSAGKVTRAIGKGLELPNEAHGYDGMLFPKIGAGDNSLLDEELPGIGGMSIQNGTQEH